MERQHHELRLLYKWCFRCWPLQPQYMLCALTPYAVSNPSNRRRRTGVPQRQRKPRRACSAVSGSWKRQRRQQRLRSRSAAGASGEAGLAQGAAGVVPAVQRQPRRQEEACPVPAAVAHASSARGAAQQQRPSLRQPCRVHCLRLRWAADTVGTAAAVAAFLGKPCSRCSAACTAACRLTCCLGGLRDAGRAGTVQVAAL